MTPLHSPNDVVRRTNHHTG